MKITKAQSDFINSTAKFIRLLAPAGCGKTMSMLEKAKALLQKNPAERINIFTYTKNAASDIKSRLGDDEAINVSTLNSWGDNYIKSRGILRNANLIDDKNKRKWLFENSMQLVLRNHEVFQKLFSNKRISAKNSENTLDLIDYFKELGFVHTKFSKDFEYNSSVYMEQFELIKNRGLSRFYSLIVDKICDLAQAKYAGANAQYKKHIWIIKNWIPFWCDCCEHMFNTGTYTYNDQKYLSCLELERALTEKKKWSGSARINYIFVDEFQDASLLDINLIYNLQKINDCGLILIGDDDQAIFEFRGATPYFILHPEEIFDQKFETFVLDVNFRSPKNIVEKSQKLISYNKNREDKKVIANDISNADIKLCQYDTQEEMIENVMEDIKNATGSVAILSRLKTDLLPYQIMMTKENIRYSVVDDLAFFYTQAAKVLTDLMEIKANNIVKSNQWANAVAAFSKKTVWENAKRELSNAFLIGGDSIDNSSDVLTKLSGEKKFAGLLTLDFIFGFSNAMDKFLQTRTVQEALSVLLNEFPGLQQNYYKARDLDDLYYKDPPLASLLSFASKWGTDFNGFINDFNRAIAYISATARNAIVDNDADHNIIKVSTALRVKGEQFDKVIVLNVDNGIWPQKKSMNTGEEMEAERRLFYVAVTRAKKELHLYRASSRGNLSSQQTGISPFVLEGEYNQ